MIYSKSTKKQKMNRIMILLMITFILGTSIGIGGTFIFHKVTAKETLSYGDERQFKEEMSRDWEDGYVLGFKPLDLPIDEGLQEFIYCLSYGYNIDYAFVLALIDQESSFDANSISNTGDYGLFQINKVNHESLMKTLGLNDISDPYENTRGGLFMLRKLFEKYESPNKVLMAYNMGERGASVLWDKDVNNTPYSLSIMEKAKEYKEMLEGKEGN